MGILRSTFDHDTNKHSIKFCSWALLLVWWPLIKMSTGLNLGKIFCFSGRTHKPREGLGEVNNSTWPCSGWVRHRQLSTSYAYFVAESLYTTPQELPQTSSSSMALASTWPYSGRVQHGRQSMRYAWFAVVSLFSRTHCQGKGWVRLILLHGPAVGGCSMEGNP